MRKIGLILICCLFYTSLVLAQSLRVNGKVIDAVDNSPMIGVTVMIQGAHKGTTTDLDGNYSIEARKNDVLVFSYIGKSSKAVTIKSQSRVDVKLTDDVNQLNDVVVVGYGTMKKRDLTGAISQVKGDDLMKGNSSLSINSALQGKVAGMQVKQNDGAPGAGLTIKVRGANSFSTDTQPLYVVDGLPYGGGGGAPDTGVPGTGSGSNPLANINPNDIESIEVLKDASSTAIYGSRGANGVVIITTKRGKEGKNNITFSADFSMSKIAKKIDVLDPVTYARYMNEQVFNSDPKAIPNYRGEWYYRTDTEGNPITNSGKYSPAPEDFANPGVYTDKYGNTSNVGSTDWQDAIFQTGSTQEYNISFDGGNAQGGYMMSLNYTNQKGIIVGSDYQRFAVRSNIWRKMNSWLEAGLNVNYTNATTNFVNSSSPGDRSGVIYSALVFPTTYDASINSNDDNELNWLATNPYVYVREAFDEYRANNIYLSSYFEATLAKGLKLRENLGFNYSGNDRNTYYNRLTSQGYKPTNGKGGQGASWSQGITSETLLSYNQTFNEDHALSALAGITFEESNWKYNRMSAYDFPSDLTMMWDMGAGGKVDPLASGRAKKRMQSNLARLSYSYKGKYMATASYRADGSSVFMEENKYAHFLSGALAWRLSAEPWIENMHLFDDLKLRLSYGQTGNQGIDTYATIPAMSVVNYVFGNVLSPGYVEQTWKGPINKDLRWETTEQLDLGLDVAFANNRVNLTIDYYYKRTKDLLQKVNIETNSGYTQRAANIGNVTNSGLEISGSFRPYIHKDLDWKIDANISFNRNEIDGLPGDQYANNFAKVSNAFVLRNGCPIGTVVGFVEDGFYDNLAEVRADGRYATITETEARSKIGEIKYRDYNNDGQITDADKRVIGDTNPDFIYGLTNTMQYKNFTFSFFLQGTYGNDIVNANTTNTFMAGIGNITREQYDTRWREDNIQDAKWPRAIANEKTREWKFTDRYVEDGSYLRLKNLSLGYAFFPKWKGIGSINLTASASNLFTITNYSWYDPDVNAFGGDVSRQGVDLYSYPSSRAFSLGVKMVF